MDYLSLVVAGILSGGIVFGGKILSMMGASPFEVMLYPNLIGTLVITPFAWKTLPKAFKVPLKVTLLLMLGVSMEVVGQYAPLFMDISVTLVLLLIYLQPVWTILIERFYFKKKISPLHWGLVAAMVIGLLFLINPFSSVQYNWFGVILALLGGVGLSLWIFITQYFSRHGIAPSASFWCTCAYTILPILILYGIANEFMTNRKILELSFDLGCELWQAFVFYLLVIYLPANMLVFFGNKKVSAGVIGMILLLEPVTGITLDVLFLHFPLTWNVICGGIIILAANVTLILSKKGS